MADALDGRLWAARGRDRPIDEAAVTQAQAHVPPPHAEREAGHVLDSASDLTRLKIGRALMETPLAASDLARVVGRSAAAAGQHIRVLREMGAVTSATERERDPYRMSREPSAAVLGTIARSFDLLARRD